MIIKPKKSPRDGDGSQGQISVYGRSNIGPQNKKLRM